MVWAKRVFFFLLVNILVITTLSLIMRVLGVEPFLTKYGLNYNSLAIYCLIWGMGGAFISLSISRMMAKWMMGVKVITPDVRDPGLQGLVERVHTLARAANLPAMPEVGIYESPEVNAFATGPTKSRSLVAVSTGLLHSMNRSEADGVLAHEVAHIANGDMVTMTLIQGIVNAFSMFLARIIAFAVGQFFGSKDGEESDGFSHLAYFATTIVMDIVFMFLGTMVVSYFSRWREFRADAGGARLAGKEKMIAALEALRRPAMLDNLDNSQPAYASMKISSKGSGLMQLFSTHPSLDDRIARLRQTA